MSEFAGRTAVVTGGSRGIGRVLSLGLAHQGVTVLAVARSADALASLEREAKKGRCIPVSADLRSPEAADIVAAALAGVSDRLDILVANAGLLGSIVPLVDLDPQVWDDCFEVNVSSAWRLVRSCDRFLMASDAARVLFVTSAITQREVVDMGIYAITKIALEALARIYAAEKRSTRIRANAFDPGPVRTGMRAQVVPDEDPNTITPPDALVPDMLRMVSPTFLENGMRFDFRRGQLTLLVPAT